MTVPRLLDMIWMILGRGWQDWAADVIVAVMAAWFVVMVCRRRRG